MTTAVESKCAAAKLKSGLDGSLTEIGAVLTVGREPDCGLCIPKSVVSRLHARIDWRDGGLWIEDQGSTNGTFVNGQRIASMTELHDGDQIAFDTLDYQLIDLVAATVDRDRTVLGMRGLQAAKLSAPAAAAESVAAATPTAPAAAEPVATAPAPIAARGAASVPVPAAAGPVVDAPPTAVMPSRDAPAPAVAAPSLPKPTPPPAIREVSLPPGIPRSWSETDQLENASHTMMMPAQLLNALAQSKVSPHAVIAAVRAERGRSQPMLIGLTPGVAGQVFLLDPTARPGHWEVGRNPEADIRIDDHSVSGRHAQVLAENGRWKLVNLMSINGCFVNERKVLSAHLNSGDRIRLGNVELAFDSGGPLPRGGARQATGETGLGARCSAIWAWLRRPWSS